MSELFIGLMSGTSMDAVDAVLVDLSGKNPKTIAHHQEFIPTDLHIALLTLCQRSENEINLMGIVDVQVGKLFAAAANAVLAKANIAPEKVRAIGSHGQNIRHHPFGPLPFTLQIGDPNTITEATGITTVADFRRRDIAQGGQGAPLAPGFHNHVFRSTKENRIILNLGGIANITWLPADANSPVIGFDTGPASTLLDAWAKQHLNKSFDANGAWAASGKIDNNLLQLLLKDPYFAQSAPKSTGREYFNLEWLNKHLAQQKTSLAAENVQATLCELTSVSIANAIKALSKTPCTIFVCGGGINNKYLLDRLQQHCAGYALRSTEECGIPPQQVEPIAFAWFAQQTLAGKPSNLPSVTGARDYAVLGGIYHA